MTDQFGLFERVILFNYLFIMTVMVMTMSVVIVQNHSPSDAVAFKSLAERGTYLLWALLVLGFFGRPASTATKLAVKRVRA